MKILDTKIQNYPNDYFIHPPKQQKNALHNKINAMKDQIRSGNYSEFIDNFIIEPFTAV